MIQPIGDRIALIVDQQEETTTSGIYIPNENKQPKNTGTILAVGDGRVLASGARVPLAVAVGDRVVFQPYAGTPISDDGEELLIMYEADIICKIKA